MSQLDVISFRESDLEKAILNYTSYVTHVLLMHHWCLHCGWSDTSDGGKGWVCWALEEVMTHVKNGQRSLSDVCRCFLIEDQLSSSSSSLKAKTSDVQAYNNMLSSVSAQNNKDYSSPDSARSTDTTVNRNRTKLELPRLCFIICFLEVEISRCASPVYI